MRAIKQLNKNAVLSFAFDAIHQRIGNRQHFREVLRRVSKAGDTDAHG